MRGAKMRVPLARLAGEGGARRSCDGRVRVGAPAAQNCTAAAPTLTRLAQLATLSRQAGEGPLYATFGGYDM